MLISILGSTLAMLTLGFASALWMLFLARIISGVCNANVSTAHAYVADRVPPTQRPLEHAPPGHVRLRSVFSIAAAAFGA